MIVCGFCHGATEPGRCSSCGHDPALPWIQRGEDPPAVDPLEHIRRTLHDAEARLRADGQTPTIERLAEQLDVSPRTVRRWRADVRPVT